MFLIPDAPSSNIATCLFSQESVVHRNLRMKSCLFENDSPWADLKIVDAAATPAPRAEGGIATAPSSTGSSRSIVRTDISGSWRSRTGKVRIPRGNDQVSSSVIVAMHVAWPSWHSQPSEKSHGTGALGDMLMIRQD